MDKKQGLGSLALIVIVAGALFRPAGGERLAHAGTGAGSAHGSGPDKPSSTSRPDDEDQADTLDVLADSLSVDTSTEGLVRRAKRSLNVLRQNTEPRARANAAEYLKSLLSLEIREDAPGLSSARDAANRLPADLKPIEAFFKRYFDRDALNVDHPSAQDKLLAEDFERVEKTALKLTLIRQAASEEPKTLIRFLIAALPDPIDSFTGWQFDPMLDAMTQAIAESDYIFDRFYFPDANRTPGSTTETGRIHEDEPSLVIFRRHIDASHSGLERRERLVLLLVHENPSAGVHDRALARAIRLVERWDGPGEEEIVRILGPTFSGSSESMVRAIKQTRRTTGERRKRIWIVSGSATDPQNKRTLEQALDAGSVTFQATVQSDDVLLATLMRHVKQIGWSTPIAVLSEGNTQYGRQMGEIAERLITHDHSRVIRLTFPINISRLRTTAQSDTSPITSVLGLPSRFRPLAMEQDGVAEDQIPPYSARTTLSYMELALSELLQTLRREHVGTVALMGTDPRDKLYLAQQIARDSPDVSIMTAESDALYGHPDYSPYLQGALVASTYPLFAGNQRWSLGVAGNSQRRQFANGSSEGIYNAALALLNYNEKGTPRDEAEGETSADSVPRLVEYSPPLERSSAETSCSAGCQPPVWISVVGRSGAWPVRAYPAGAGRYVFPVHVGAERQDLLTTFPSRLFVATWIALVALTLVLWTGARTRLLVAARPLKGAGFLLAGILSLFVIAAFVTAILLARFRIERTFWSGAASAATLVSLFLLVDLTRRVIVRGWPARNRASEAGARATFAVGIGAIVALWAVGNLLLFLGPFIVPERFGGQPSADGVGFVTRAINFGSGVSPILPVLFLTAALALWAIAELKRAWTPGVALADPAVQQLIGRTISGDVDTLSARWTFFNRSIVAVPSPLAALVAIAVAGVCAFMFDPVVAPLVTSEGRWFGRLVSTGFLLTEALIALSILQVIYLWRGLRPLLEQMTWHPLGDAYQRVPPELFPPAVFPKIPRLMELQLVVTRWQQHVSSGSLASAHIFDAGDGMDAMFRNDMRTSSTQHWSMSRTWKQLVAALARPASEPALAGIGMTPVALSDPADQHEHELIAISMALVIRDAIARLGHNLLFILGGMLLVFCAHTLFPFQLHTQLAALDWSGIGLAFGAIVVVIVQMKRNEIIARLSSANAAERATWDSEFVLKLVIFCLVPLLTLFATQFPDLGATVLRWVEPVEKALP